MPNNNDSTNLFAPLNSVKPVEADSSAMFAPLGKSTPTAQEQPANTDKPTQDAGASSFIQSTYDPDLGLTIPTIAPQAQLQPDKSFWSSVWDGFKGLLSAPNEPEKTSKYSLYSNKNYDQSNNGISNVFDPALGLTVPTLNQVLSDKLDGVKDVTNKADVQIGERQKLNDQLNSQDSGPGIDIAATVKDAETLSDPLAEFHSSLGLTGPSPKSLEELNNLGYGYANDPITGKMTLQPVGKPVYTPEQIQAKLTGITQNFSAQTSQLNKDIRDLEDSKKPVQNVTDEGGNLSTSEAERSPEAIADANSKIADKKKQIQDLIQKYNNVSSLYGNVANAQTYLGNSDAATATAEFLKNATSEAPPDWHKFTDVQKNAKQTFDQIASDPDLLKNLTNLGLQYTYVTNDYDAFEAKEALRNPGAGFLHLGKALPQSIIDQWTLNAIIPNARSLQSSIDYDQKVLKELGVARTTTIEDAKTKGTPIEVVNESLVKSGMSDGMEALSASIKSKQDLLNTITAPVKTGLKDLVALKASQTYFDQLYKTNSTKIGLAFGVGAGLQDIVDGASTIKYLFNKSNPAETFKQFKTNDYRLEYQAPTVDVDIDGKKAKVPFFTKDVNLFSSEPTNWDVLLYHGTKMSTSLIPMMLSGAAAEGVGAKVLVSQGAKNLALSAAFEGAGLEGLAGEGIGYQAGNLALKAGVKATVATTGYALPGMLMFSPEMIRSEMQNKSLTEAQAINLGLTRGLIEGYAFSINPFEMGNTAKGILEGTISNPIEHEAYNTLTKKSLTNLLGFEVNSFGYNLLMNASYIPKSISKEAVTLATQQNLSLVGNALASKATQAMADPNYYNANYELTEQNILNTTINAIATSIPFGLMHIKGVKDQAELARNSALFQVGQAPDWYINHIDERLNSGDIDAAEAYRQTNVINQTKAVVDGLKPGFSQIDISQGKSLQEKHELKMKLFSTRMKEAGIAELLAKDLSPTDRFNLEEQLLTTSEKFQEHLKDIDSYDKLSPEGKEKATSQAFWNDNREFFYPQNIQDLPISELDARRASLENISKSTTNPYMLKYADSLRKSYEILMASSRFGSEAKPEYLRSQMFELKDKIEDLRARGYEQYESNHRKNEDIGTTGRESFVDNFVEKHLDERELGLYKSTFPTQGLSSSTTEDITTPTEEVKETPKKTESTKLASEKARINDITDLDELAKERKLSVKNKDLTKEERTDLHKHIGRHIEELDVKSKQVSIGDKTFQKGDFVRVKGNSELFRVQGLNEEGRLVVRIGKDDEALEKTISEINARKAAEIASSSEDIRPGIEVKYAREIKAASRKTEIHVSNADDVTLVSGEEKNKYFDDLDKKAHDKKIEDESSAAQTALTETEVTSKSVAGKSILDATNPETLKKKGLDRTDVELAIVQLEAGIAANKDLGKILQKGNFPKLLDNDSKTLEALAQALKDDPQATVTKLREEFSALAPDVTESVVSTKDPLSMSKEELEEEHRANNRLLISNLFNTTNMSAEEFTRLSERQKSLANILEPAEIPLEVKSEAEVQKELEKEAKEVTEIRTSRVFSPLSTAPQQSTGKGVATDDIVAAQVATFDSLRTKREETGKTYLEMGYYATVMNNSFPIDPRFQKQDVIDDYGKGELSLDTIRDGRIVALTDKDGVIKHFDKAGNPSTETAGFPIYQNLRGQIKKGNLVLKNEPSQESLVKSGELDSYNKERDQLEKLKKSKSPVTFEIKEITSGFQSSKPNFEPIVLGSNISFLKTRKGQMMVFDSNTDAQMAVSSSPSLANSTIKEDILAILDMDNKTGLPADLKDSFDNRVRVYVEKFLFTHGDGAYGPNNRLRLNSEGKAVRLDGKPVEDLLLNIDFTRLGKEVSYYKWDGHKFSEEVLNYNQYIADNYKVYRPITSSIDSYVKLGNEVTKDEPIKKVKKSKKTSKTEDITPETVTKGTPAKGEFEVKKKRKMVDGDTKLKNLGGEEAEPTKEC